MDNALTDLKQGHTPGPWEAEYGTDGYFYVTHDDGLENRSNPVADARLIAAAPDMLRALERINHTLAVHGKVDCGTDLACFVSEVLAKATGAA